MNRIIEFRGLDKLTEKWVYGSLLATPSGVYIVSHYRESSDQEWQREDFEVIPETVGQYTNVNTESGKKIYEGDKVKPTKFNDIDNTVICIDGSFFRYKEHNGKPYINRLGSCNLMLTGTIFDK